MKHTRLWSVFLLVGMSLALPAVVAVAQQEKDKAAAKQPAGKDAAKADPAKPDDAKTPPKPDQPATPVEATVTLTVEQVDAAIKQTQDSTDLDDDAKATITKQWTDAKSELTTEAAERAEAAKAKQQLETLPAETERIKKELEAAAKTPATPFVPAVTPQTTSKQLEGQLTAAKTELADRQQALTRLEDQLKTLKDEPTKLRDDLKKAQTDLDAAEKALAAPPVAGENARLTAARKARLDASRRARRATIARIEQQLLTYDVRGPYLETMRNQAAALVPPADQKVKAIQDALTKLIKEETDRAAADAEKARLEAMHKDPQVFKLTEANAQAAKLNAKLAEDRTALELKVADAKRLIEGIRKELADAEKKIKDRGGLDKRLARDLIKRRRTLPNERQLNRAMDEMEARERDYEAATDALQSRRKELDSVDAVVQSIMSQVAPTGSVKLAEIEAEVRKLLTTQKELIGKQLEAYGTVFQQTRELHEITQNTVEASAKFSRFIDENLLWIADAEPLRLKSFGEAGAALGWLAGPTNWAEFGINLRDASISAAVPTAIMLIVFVALLVVRRRVNVALANIDGQLKRIDTDHFSLTPRAILLTLLIALPVPALLLYVSILLGRSTVTDFTRASAAGLGAAAIGYYMLRTLINLLRPQGVCETHLRWTPHATGILRRNLLWLLLLLPPAAYVIVTLMTDENDEHIDSLARFVYIAFMIAIAVFLFRVLHPVKGAVAQTIKDNPGSLLARTRHLWITLTLLMPLTPAVLAALGFFYTARQVGGNRLSLTLWMMLGILLLHGLLLRWLYVAQRKLALQKAREKREARVAAATAAGESPDAQPAPVADNTIDIAQINEQTRQIVRSLLAVATVVGLYLIWSGVLPALRVLDQLNLWAHATKPDGTPVYITLANVLLAILIGFLTAVASKNLPGLLEITILKRTPLDAGGRYAFATITRYVISAVGIVAAFQAIGIGWSQVQWLVAAVSLGLGFGLQEIFANFVSGLIILFERPIRVGDVVTVGDTSGTVSRIRIRATTIVSFERKELIVPNKEFITSRVLNWTLSDTVTRVTINVGVAYGTNLQLAQRLLLEQARANPLVMEDPAPSVVVAGFGESSIDLTLNMFVRTLADRLPVTNGMYEAIDRVFTENNIDVPFPQRDLHVHMASPGMTLGGNGHPDNGQGQPAPTSTVKAGI